MDLPRSATAAGGAADSVARLEAVEIATGPRPTAAIIWLHGLGADGHDFEPVVPQLAWAGAPDIRYLFPHAPVRPVTVNGGMPMRAWYDILSLTSARGQDERGIAGSVDAATQLVRREIGRGIPARNIILAGFSQGGAIAIHAALRFPERLAGLIALSSYLLLPDELAGERSEANADLPVFIAHGSMDPVIPQAMGERAARWLEERGHSVEWHSYPMVHAVCPQEVAHLAAWIKSRLG